MLPAYGPMISSSYAELLPEHDHVMLAGTPSHSHAYEQPGYSGASDVLAIPGSAGDGAIAVVVATAAALLSHWALLAAPTGLRRLAAKPGLELLRGLTLVPTAPPPKPALSIS